MQINELVTFAADVGRGLLESGAETSRVEDTVERIIRHFYDGKSEVLVVMTGLFVTVGDVTKTVRVRRRTINLDKVSILHPEVDSLYIDNTYSIMCVKCRKLFARAYVKPIF